MLPALERLQAAGFALTCVGKGWSKSLLEAHGWPIHTYPKRLGERATLLKQIRQSLPAAAQKDEINAITFATSFSSALDMRLAGLKAFGYAVEGRSFLLKKTAPIVYGEHAMHSYWRLANQLLNENLAAPSHATLKVSDAAQLIAERALAEAKVGQGYVVAVPFAGGTFEKLDKKWTHFAQFIERFAKETGRDVVLAPGPDEVALARERYPRATLLQNLALGPYAAVLRQASLVVSNDTGPGHMTASCGGNLLSVLGPTKVEQWGPLGQHVEIVQSYPEWPSVDRVMEVALQRLR